METFSGTSSCMTRCRASPSRTTRSMGLDRLVMMVGRRDYRPSEMKLLPWAPVSSRPLSKTIVEDPSGLRIVPGRINGWHRYFGSTEIADAS